MRAELWRPPRRPRRQQAAVLAAVDRLLVVAPPTEMPTEFADALEQLRRTRVERG